LAARVYFRTMRKLAAELGMTFSPDDTLGIPELCAPVMVSALDPGHRLAYNVLGGTFRGRDVVAFDHAMGHQSPRGDVGMQFAHGDEAHGRPGEELTAALWRCDGLSFPWLTIRPEHAGDKVRSAVGLADINFESEEFSKRFHVMSDNRKFASDMLHPRMMEHLLAHPGWGIEVAGPVVIIHNGRQWKPADYRQAFETLTGFLELVPRFVWKERGERL
jgi:hypothetical protein